MFALTKLPRFMEYLYQPYQKYYSLYNGRLIELFPCSEATEDSLAIADDDQSTYQEDDQIYQLWTTFETDPENQSSNH